MFICMQTINVIPPFFLEILQIYYKLVILGTLGMFGYGHQNDGISWQKTRMFIFIQKIKLIFSFLQILLGFYKLVILCTLVMSGHAHPKNSINY